MARELGETFNVERKLRTVLRYCAAGYLSKGYGTFGKSALQDAADEDVRRRLRALHPQMQEGEAAASAALRDMVAEAELAYEVEMSSLGTDMGAYRAHERPRTRA